MPPFIKPSPSAFVVGEKGIISRVSFSVYLRNNILRDPVYLALYKLLPHQKEKGVDTNIVDGIYDNSFPVCSNLEC